MSSQKVWFVTGASKGLGMAMIKLLLSKGHKVIATLRNIEALKAICTEHKILFYR